MSSMSIGQIGNICGLAPSAIRYYEKAGLLPKPIRVNGQRRYGNEAIGRLRASVADLQRRIDENQKLQERRYADQRVALNELVQKLDQHAASIESIRPTVAALELARSKLVTWASIGFASVVLLGWIVEAAIKWAVTATLSHFQ